MTPAGPCNHHAKCLIQEERRGEWSQIPARAHEHRPPIVGNSKDVDGMKIQIGRPRAANVDVMSPSRSPGRRFGHRLLVSMEANRKEVGIYFMGLDRSQWVKRSEVIYTLNQERYSTRKNERSLLRTNTTGPSKCDRTANTMRGWGWR